jgi:ribosome-binding ATPase YchF (GTP1/OBG family)
MSEENEPLSDFQTVTDELILVIESIIDKSWIELTKEGGFDSERLREHENLVTLFSRFKEKYECLDEVKADLKWFKEN